MAASTRITVESGHKQRISGDQWIGRCFLVLIVAWFGLFLVVPLLAMLSRSARGTDGSFVGSANFAQYFSTPALAISIQNSLFVAMLSTVITIGLAFPFAYGLTRSRMQCRLLLRGIAYVPMLAPSLLPAISIRYLFGNQGYLNWMMGDHSIYGPIGIVMAEVFHVFPHALIILVTALATADGRLYEAALSLHPSRLRAFFYVTLPGARYGLISATFVAFTLVVTDFGIPKVIGGNFNVLATDIYKQVFGQHNLEMGAVLGVLLLVPAVLAFALERLAQRQHVSVVSSRAVPYEPKPSRLFDMTMFTYCGVVSLLILGVIAISAYASLLTYWPYNLTFTLSNYDFYRVDDTGWMAYFNSIQMAAWTTLFGTIIVFCSAYLIEKSQGARVVRAAAQFFSIIPLAVPGLVLGISYILFFNQPDNPLNFLYRSMPILVVSTIVHYYTVAHLTATTALKQIDTEFESVSASLKIPFYITFWRVTVPVSLPAIFDIATYLFVNAMTTTSAVIFLYSSETVPASVAIVNMDETGAIASAAAMAIMIVITSAAVRTLHFVLTRGLVGRTQEWRKQ